MPSIRQIRHPTAVQPETCIRFLQQMRVVFAFMDREGIASIPDLEQKHLDAFLGEIREGTVTNFWRAGLLKVFDLFYESRDHLSSGGLAFHPFPSKSLLALAGYEKPDECLTERIPEGVMKHAFFWALAYVDTFSDDICAAEARRRATPSKSALAEAERRTIVAAPSLVAAEAERIAKGSRIVPMPLRNAKRLEVYLDGLKAGGGGIPAKMHNGRIGIAFEIVRARSGVSAGSLKQGANSLAAQMLASGLPLRLECLGPPKASLPGARAVWREPFTVRGLEDECRRLQVAAYIVVAYLSGMRDSEVQTLKRGCLEELRDERGEIYRYKLNGEAIKGQRGRSKKRKWVVVEPVARAVRVLERLTAHLHASKLEGYLFARLRHADDSMGLFQGNINIQLRAFVDHCERVIAPRQSGADLPERPVPKTGPWPFKPTQFRRTLAWHIANQPFGVVAGMIQYGHASIQMFEGYAGSPDSGFAAEVAKDRFMARLGDVHEMFQDDERGVRPAGPMAEELSSYFARKREELGAFPGEVADAKRVRELLKQKAADLHVGRLVHCFYTPAQARCQAHLEASKRTEPLTGLCDPDCPNACWAQKDLEAWKLLQWEVDAMLKVNSIPHRQREILRRQQATARRVVKAIGDAGEKKEPARGQVCSY